MRPRDIDSVAIEEFLFDFNAVAHLHIYCK